MIYQRLVRPWLFATTAKDPEHAHERALGMLAYLGRHGTLRSLVALHYAVDDYRLRQKVLGLSFDTPIGLAAGFDKNGVAIQGLEALGFSHIEMGTITPLEQVGNPRQRMFRLTADQAIINRMGFNNQGKDVVRLRLRQAAVPRIPLGISLGKGKDTPLDQAVSDYLSVLDALWKYGDYFVVNVSSPNTANLRDLQESAKLGRLLGRLYEEGGYQAEQCRTRRKPLLVKIAPDLSDDELRSIVDVCLEQKVDGIIATNTTIQRDGLRTTITETGGLSGQPLFLRSLNFVKLIRSRVPAGYPIIGVGGIGDAEQAYAMLKAGATLLQGYTGFVYRGPSYARDINHGIIARMERDGVTRLSELHRLG